jgi:DNA-binding beta-propeller fold protein YncE
LQQFKLTYDPAAPRRIDPEMTRFSFAWDFETLRASMPDPKPTWPIEPAAIRNDKNRVLYVVDRRNDQVHVFDQSMKYIRSWGKHGGGTGEFRGPTDLSFSKSGETVFVVDSLNRRVQAFDLQGTLRQSWRIENSNSGALAKPFGITSGKDGFVYVTDTAGGRVLKFDEQGRFIKQWSEAGGKMGQLWKPRGITQDERMRVFVIDQGNHRAQIFDVDGTWLVTFGAGAAYTPTNTPRNE